MNVRLTLSILESDDDVLSHDCPYGASPRDECIDKIHQLAIEIERILHHKSAEVVIDDNILEITTSCETFDEFIKLTKNIFDGYKCYFIIKDIKKVNN